MSKTAKFGLKTQGILGVNMFESILVYFYICECIYNIFECTYNIFMVYFDVFIVFLNVL
jgi:hypothetical protein